MNTTSGRKSLWGHYLLIAALLFFMAASLWDFIQENQERILKQNQEYAVDASRQTARRIEDRINVRKKTLNVLVYTLSEMITGPSVSSEDLKFLQETSVFDYVEFIDANGLNHNAEGKTSNAVDRENYIRGMKGETGYHVIFHSRITNETLVNFYAPVMLDGEIIGVLNGMLREETLREVLSAEFFGKNAKAFICMDDGTVISFCGYEEKPMDNLLDGLKQDKVVSEETLLDIKDAFANHESYPFFAEGSSGKSSVSIVPVADDWMLVQTFPSAVTKQMNENANKAGLELMVKLFVLFLAYVAYLIVSGVKKRRLLSSEKARLNNIVQSLAPLFTRLAILDYKRQSYEYIKGVPSDLQTKGPLSYLREYMNTHYIHESDVFPMESVFQGEEIKNRLAEGAPYLQYEYRVKWDTEHWEALSVLPLEQKEEEVFSAIFAVQDVTILKKQEMAIQNALRDAFHAAEDLSLAKSSFLARMSHDMRTPMNAVLGMAQVAVSHLDDKERVRVCLEKIDASGRKLLMLINEVLDMSKIESGGIVLEEAPFVLTKAVDEIAQEASLSASQKGQRFQLDMGKIDNDQVLGDRGRLKQVLWNLLDNAIKYTPTGGEIHLRVNELASRVPKGGYYEFIVEDTGIGIEEELHPKIFEPFVRSGSHGKETGTGLGLPIAQAIAKLMDGEIRFESEIGQGSKFIVHIFLKFPDPVPQLLPKIKDAALPQPLSETKDAPSPKTPLEIDETEASKDSPAILEKPSDRLMRHAGTRVLLVEDNEINTEIAVEILAMAGIEAETAENGAAAVSIVQERPADYYDIILMDLQMPVMDGYEAARTIRSLGREDLSRIPIIAVSANAFQENISKARDMGMNGHIMKPIDLERVLEAFDEYLSKT